MLKVSLLWRGDDLFNIPHFICCQLGRALLAACKVRDVDYDHGQVGAVCEVVPPFKQIKHHSMS